MKAILRRIVGMKGRDRWAVWLAVSLLLALPANVTFGVHLLEHIRPFGVTRACHGGEWSLPSAMARFLLHLGEFSVYPTAGLGVVAFWCVFRRDVRWAMKLGLVLLAVVTGLSMQGITAVLERSVRMR